MRLRDANSMQEAALNQALKKLPQSRQFKNEPAGMKASGIFCPLKGASGWKPAQSDTYSLQRGKKNDVLLWKQAHFWESSLINESFLRCWFQCQLIKSYWPILFLSLLCFLRCFVFNEKNCFIFNYFLFNTFIHGCPADNHNRKFFFSVRIWALRRH